MTEPGGLQHLGEAGRRTWHQRFERCLSTMVGELGPNPFLLSAPDDRTPFTVAVDWTGLPLRVTECLGRRQGLELLDWRSEHGDEGRRRLQEEYIEWRVVRHEGAIRRVELTTELSDYWRVLAAYEPRRTLELVASFARTTHVPPEMVYGACDPFAASTTDRQREDAFVATMVSAGNPSPYNDGRAAICCMVQRTNTLDSLVAMALAGTNPRMVRDAISGRLRCLTCEEAIPLMGSAAMAGRGSDPVMAERLARLAYEGRLVAFDDPVGIYMQSVEHARLRTPGGEAVPASWFSFSRGLGPAHTCDRRPRWQRLVFEPPPGSGVTVEQVVDVTTERPIRYGGQIAELVQLAVVLRVSAPDLAPAGSPDPVELAEALSDASGCAGLRQVLGSFAAAVAMGRPSVRRTG